MMNKPHNKKLICKYLGNLFCKNVSIYSHLNPKHTNSVRPCCIITITGTIMGS